MWWVIIALVCIIALALILRLILPSRLSFRWYVEGALVLLAIGWVSIFYKQSTENLIGFGIIPAVLFLTLVHEWFHVFWKTNKTVDGDTHPKEVHQHSKSSPASVVAESHFKDVAAQAALFELRLRMTAGQISELKNLPINTNLSTLCDALLSRCGGQLKGADIERLKNACALRNKILHCEFSAARQRLNQVNKEPTEGGVQFIDIKGIGANAIENKLRDFQNGKDAGQISVGSTNVRTLGDVFGWFLEFQSADEFREASSRFKDAIAILDQLR